MSLHIVCLELLIPTRRLVMIIHRKHLALLFGGESARDRRKQKSIKRQCLLVFGDMDGEQRLQHLQHLQRTYRSQLPITESAHVSLTDLLDAA